MTDIPDDGVVDAEIVLPFVVVHSVGGPYADDAFTAGWQAAEIDRDLRALAAIECNVTTVRAARKDLVPQLDLIAMRHGFALTTSPWGDGWVIARFARQAQATS